MKNTACVHDWWVYSTALASGVLMLYCERCKAEGVVRDPTKIEWMTAFYAPSNPYRWKQKERVELTHKP